MKNSNNFTPVAVYPNAHLQVKLILQENKGRSGVYRWVNLINGKSYIGSSVDLQNRLRQYFNRNELKRNNNMLIFMALLKHGYSNFTLEILKYCSPEKCIKWEQLFLDLLNPEYNILKNAYSSLGYKHAESRAKISATVKGIPKP
jgi:group I intron endonuclease